jgi:hypothetical protein
MEMTKNAITQGSNEKEHDLLNILQESTLYVELTLDEKYMLLRHIADFYRSISTGMPIE